MTNQQKKWFYLTLLSFVWGSSFILMKKALVTLSPVQLGALRVLITAVFVLIVGHKGLRKVQKKHWIYLFYTALFGSFFPVFLFAYAVKGIDSSIVSILNSLTPFNTFIVGVLLFGYRFRKKQFLGILVGLMGTTLLILKGADINPNQQYEYSFLVILASVGYAFNVNMIKKYLSDLDALTITAGNFLFLIIPSLVVLLFTGFFTNFEYNEAGVTSLGYITILAILGTGLAKILYVKMVHIATPVFASSVTYVIPIIAVLWGIMDGEKLDFLQLMAGGIILFGVYLVNKNK